MTIYTVIIGNYDDLKEPFIITPGWKYVCFTDQDFKSNVWEIRKVECIKKLGNIKTARYYKIMGPSLIEDEFTIFVDGTFFINCNLNEWAKQCKHDFTTIRHPFDRCLYKDADSCINSGKGKEEDIKRQLIDYRIYGVPHDNGLISSGILMRKRTPDVLKTCELWWEHVYEYSSRDQIAFGFVNWKYPWGHESFDWDYTYMKEFIHIPHITKRWRDEKMMRIKELYGKVNTN